MRGGRGEKQAGPRGLPSGSLIIRRARGSLFRYAGLEKHLLSRRNVTIIESATSRHLSLSMRLPTRLRARARLIIVSYGPYGTNNERVWSNPEYRLGGLEDRIDEEREVEEFEASELVGSLDFYANRRSTERWGSREANGQKEGKEREMGRVSHER